MTEAMEGYYGYVDNVMGGGGYCDHVNNVPFRRIQK